MKDTVKLLKCMCLLLACLLLSYPAIAQEMEGETFSIPVSDPDKPGKLKFHLVSGSISITGHNQQEVRITAKRREKNKAPKEREGLKSLANKNLEYSVEEHENTVFIKAWPSGTVDFEVQVPKDFSLNVKTVNNGKIYVENVNGEFEVSNINGPILMKNIGGSVIADAMNQDIKVEFSETNNHPMAFSNFNGDIDITFPSNLKANIKARTQLGEIFTDFELKVDPSKPTVKKKGESGTYKVVKNEWVSGSLNGGGPEIKFQSHNGDIMIRKGKQ